MNRRQLWASLCAGALCCGVGVSAIALASAAPATHKTRVAVPQGSAPVLTAQESALRSQALTNLALQTHSAGGTTTLTVIKRSTWAEVQAVANPLGGIVQSGPGYPGDTPVYVIFQGGSLPMGEPTPDGSAPSAYPGVMTVEEPGTLRPIVIWALKSSQEPTWYASLLDEGNG